jgi:hypothetical protein
MSAIFKMAAKTQNKKWTVKIQHCLISSNFDMWVDKDVPILMISDNAEFLRYCGAILKMETSRNCSMSGINSGHHYLSTYQILMISDNVEFLPSIFYAVFWQLF